MIEKINIDGDKKTISIDEYIFPVEKVWYHTRIIGDVAMREVGFRSKWNSLAIMSFFAAFFTYGYALIPMAFFIWLGNSSADKQYKAHIKKALNSPERLKNVALFKTVSILYSYFKQNIPIYSELKKEFTFLGGDSFESNNMDKLMFNIYQKAFLIGADGIIINNNDVSNEVSGQIAGYTAGGSNNSSVEGRIAGNTSTKTTYHKHVSFIKTNK